MFADAGEHIEHFAPVRFRVLNAVRRDDRQSIRPGKIDQLSVDLLFATKEMPLNFDEHIFATECIDQRLNTISGTVGDAVSVPSSNWEADCFPYKYNQSLGELR